MKEMSLFPPQVFTVPEAAALLRVSDKKMYRMARTGVVPRLKVGRSVRILRSDFEKYVEGVRTVGSPKQS